MSITVETASGNIFPLVMTGTSCLIKDLKAEIQNMKKVPSNRQHLFFNGVELKDAYSLDDYDIRNGSVLLLNIHIFVKTLTGQVVTLDVDPLDTIQDVKAKISDKERIPPAQQLLFYAGKQLNHRQRLSDLELNKASMLTLVITHINIHVEMVDEPTLTLEVHESDFICDVKQMIQERTGIPKSKQRLELILNQKKLGSFETLSSYNIKNNSKLRLVLIYRPMLIFIKTMCDRIVNLNVNGTDTVEDVKELIYEEIGDPPDQQRLIFAGKQLEDCRTLNEYKIKNKSKLHLVLRLKGCICGCTPEAPEEK